MSENTLYDKVMKLHTAAILDNGQRQVVVGRHYMHDVTSCPAFGMLEEDEKGVLMPDLTTATADHMTPTDDQSRPFDDPQAETLVSALEGYTNRHDITFYGPGSKNYGVIHVIGPELGQSQPGMLISCGDSHTSTHGAFGAVAFGVGSTQVRHILETQSVAIDPLKVKRIDVEGELQEGVYAKDVILYIIQQLGVGGGKGFAYEIGGSVIDNMSMEGRLTVCNMGIEGGALVTYINPDQTTFDYLKGREFVPKGEEFERAVKYWGSIASGPDAEYDDVISFDGSKIEPMVTYGVNPGQVVSVTGNIPDLDSVPESEQGGLSSALEYMGLEPGQAMEGTKIDYAFIGSCTNGRLSDLEEAARILKGNHIADGVTMLVVPGSAQIKKQAEELDLDRIFTEAGAEWRYAGCSMCLGMNPDIVPPGQYSASSSNRNFRGRQGPDARTMLMSPAMVAVAAIEGKVVDVREDYLRKENGK